MKIFVSTGEVSGDLHLSYLIKHMKEIDSNIEFYGVVGENCKKLGVESLYDIKELAVMGFVEGLKKYRFLKKKAYEYINFIKDNQIEKVILVDYGGFNLEFLKLIKKYCPNVEVYYYIPPKLWVWGKKRIKTLRLADHIIVIFPWEVEFYKNYNMDVVYLGNPFIEKYSLIEDRGEKILLLPGSRKREVKTSLPIMLEVVKRNKNKNYILKLPDMETFNWIEENLNEYPNLEIYNGSLEEAVKKSKLSIATSGTVTLELAIMGIPTVVVYKPGHLNYLIGKYILKLKYVALPNLAENKEVFKELLDRDFTVENVERATEEIINNLDSYNTAVENIRNKLYGENITKGYGKYIIKGR